MKTQMPEKENGCDIKAKRKEKEGGLSAASTTTK